MRALYLDIFSGISGDMFIGAMLDLGVDAVELERQLSKLAVTGYHLHVSRQQRGQIAGAKFDVHVGDHTHHHEDEDHHHEHDHGDHGHEHEQEHHHHHEHEDAHGRSFADICKLISASELPPWVKENAIAVFERIAKAEGKIHGQPPEKVHFHEVGALDSIVDVVGACIALDLLGRPKVLAGPVVEGTGTIQCAHGRFPIPAPATLEILSARSVPVTQCDELHELVTPTGAAILAQFAATFGPLHNFVPTKTGYGLGTRENKTRPNVLRAILGEIGEGPSAHDWESDTITVIETNIDDLAPEILGSVVERALAAGALDVFHTPIQMKKNRPGVLFTILCPSQDADRFCHLLLTETSAFGVRRHSADRRKLKREIVQVKTLFGDVAVKIGRLDGKTVQVSPEYESCRKLADAAGIPVKHVYEAALRPPRP